MNLIPFSDRPPCSSSACSSELDAGGTELSRALHAATVARPTLHSQLLGAPLPPSLEGGKGTEDSLADGVAGPEYSANFLLHTGPQELAHPPGSTSHARLLFNPPSTGFVPVVPYVTNSLHQQQAHDTTFRRRPQSARKPYEREPVGNAGASETQRPASALGTAGTGASCDHLVTSIPGDCQNLRTSHMIAGFSQPKAIPGRFRGIQHRLNVAPDTAGSAERGHSVGKESSVQGAFQVDACPPCNHTQVQTHSVLFPARNDIQHAEPGHDGAAKVTMYNLDFGDVEPLLHNRWTHSTRLSVANPQKGFRNR